MLMFQNALIGKLLKMPRVSLAEISVKTENRWEKGRVMASCSLLCSLVVAQIVNLFMEKRLCRLFFAGGISYDN